MLQKQGIPKFLKWIYNSNIHIPRYLDKYGFHSAEYQIPNEVPRSILLISFRAFSNSPWPSNLT